MAEGMERAEGAQGAEGTARTGWAGFASQIFMSAWQIAKRVFLTFSLDWTIFSGGFPSFGI